MTCCLGLSQLTQVAPGLIRWALQNRRTISVLLDGVAPLLTNPPPCINSTTRQNPTMYNPTFTFFFNQGAKWNKKMGGRSPVITFGVFHVKNVTVYSTVGHPLSLQDLI